MQMQSFQRDTSVAPADRITNATLYSEYLTCENGKS